MRRFDWRQAKAMTSEVDFGIVTPDGLSSVAASAWESAGEMMMARSGNREMGFILEAVFCRSGGWSLGVELSEDALSRMTLAARTNKESLLPRVLGRVLKDESFESVSWSKD